MAGVWATAIGAEPLLKGGASTQLVLTAVAPIDLTMTQIEMLRQLLKPRIALLTALFCRSLELSTTHLSAVPA